MAKTKVSNVKLKGIVCVVPKTVRDNGYFSEIFGSKVMKNITKMTGVETRRITDSNTCTSDLCYEAAEKLIAGLEWERESIEALILVTQSPDYVLPASSCILQDRLGLSTECASFDINLGCSGYVYGLWVASNLIVGSSLKRVLLLVGDTSSKLISIKDRSTAPLFGDAGSATALEYSTEAKDSFYVLGTDGKGKDNLIIPAGGNRKPSSHETLKEFKRDNGSIRSEEDLFMDGGEIFNFTLSRVTNLIKDTLEFGQMKIDDIDLFLFHQANKFILEHLTKKLDVSLKKVPLSIKEFGNTSSASIPLTLILNQNISSCEDFSKTLMTGFGVGYSWASVLMDIDKLSHVELIEI